MIKDSFNIVLDIQLTKRLRRSLGWIYKSTKYGQMIRAVNKVKRLDFCHRMIGLSETFEDCIFSDECSVQLENHKRKLFAKKGDKLITLRSKAKHPVKVHVWAGVSCRGATKLCIFDGSVRMDSEIFVEIIRHFYVPFAAEKYGNNCRLIQDNDPKHNSNYTTTKFAELGIKKLAWPPESPDLNVIELVWHQLKEHLRSITKPTNKQELIDGIGEFWRSKMTKAQCQNYVNHIFKVMPKVIEAEGGPIYE